MSKYRGQRPDLCELARSLSPFLPEAERVRLARERLERRRHRIRVEGWQAAGFGSQHDGDNQAGPLGGGL